jgi:uncharacterized protein YbjQ (UPF0145 family)
VSALGTGLDVTDDGAFRSGLSQAGQKRALDRELAPELGPESIAQIEGAAREVGADAVVVVRLQGDDKSRSATVVLVDASTGLVPVAKVQLDAAARDRDGQMIAQSLRAVLSKYGGEAEPPPADAATKPGSRTILPDVLPSPGARGERASRENVFDAAGAFANSMFSMEVGAEAVGRKYSYRSGITPSSDDFSLFPAPAVGAHAKLFPLQELGRPWADIGIAADVTLTFVQASQLGGASATTLPLAYGGAFYGRFHPTKSERVLIGLSVGYALSSFGPVGPPTAELPDVHYRAVRAAVDGRLAFGRFAATAAAGFRVMVDPNDVSTGFYNPSGYGLDAEVGGSFMFARQFDVRLAGRYERYSFSFAPGPETFAAGSALDESFAVRLSLGFIYE